MAEERLGRTLGITSKLVREHFDQTLRAAGSSFPAYLLLRHASQSPGVSQRQLADKLGIEAPTLVRHIDRLASDGLVERVPHVRDRRVSHVQLTEAGRAHLDRIEAVATEMNAELAGLFTAPELAALTRFLNRIWAAYGRDTKEGDDSQRVG
jgi:MarR family transcriptional regulator, transcriptional regulator for hemolysin